MRIPRIGRFEKVSLGQYAKDCMKLFVREEKKEDGTVEEVTVPAETVIEMYNRIELPSRATTGSAGYDISLPFPVTLGAGESVTVPTGLRVKMKPGWVLMIVPRSSLGFKFRLQLDNTVGVIDSDYYNAENEGHILLRVTNDSRFENTLNYNSLTGLCQGIFMQYGITTDDTASKTRKGGFGSTDEEKKPNEG